MKILITGTAGFIGFHLVNKLLKETDWQIVGLDNINDYYDVNLKYARLKETGIDRDKIEEAENQSFNLSWRSEDGSFNHSISDADELLTSYSLLLNSEVVAIDPNYYRPTEVNILIGDASKVQDKLGWKVKTKIEKLVKLMVESDFQKILIKGY